MTLMRSADDKVKCFAIVIVLIGLLAIAAFGLDPETSPITGTITGKKSYPESTPVYHWTPWIHELIITSEDGRAGYGVRVSPDVYDNVEVGDLVKRNRPFIQEER